MFKKIRSELTAIREKLLARKPKPNEYGDVAFITAQEARDRMQMQFKISAIDAYDPIKIQHKISTATRDLQYSAYISIKDTALGPLLMPIEIQNHLIKIGYTVRLSESKASYVISWRP